MHADRGFYDAADGGPQQRAEQGNVGERRGSSRIGPVFVVQFLQVIGISQPLDRMQQRIVGPLLFLGSIEGDVFRPGLVQDAPVWTPCLDARSLRAKPASAIEFNAARILLDKRAYNEQCVYTHLDLHPRRPRSSLPSAEFQEPFRHSRTHFGEEL